MSNQRQPELLGLCEKARELNIETWKLTQMALVGDRGVVIHTVHQSDGLPSPNPALQEYSRDLSALPPIFIIDRVY